MDNEAVEELKQVETTEEATNSNDEVVEETAETPVEDSTTGEIQADEQLPKKEGKGVRKRINKLTKEKFEAQEKVKELERRLATKPIVTTEEPKVDDFATYEEFEQASLSSKVDKAVDDRLKANQDTDKANAEATRRTGVIASYNANVEAYAETVEDFFEVTGDMAVMNNSITEAVIESEKSAQLHYYLGNNPEVLASLSNLSPLSVAREIGKLEGLLEKPPAIKKVTSTPDPITPVGSNGGSANNKPSSKDDTATWMAKRNAELREKRKR